MKNAPGMYLRAGVCELLRERDFFEKTGISDDDGISTWFFLLCSSLRVEFLNLARKNCSRKVLHGTSQYGDYQLLT